MSDAIKSENFVIRDALDRCVEVLSSHNKIMCSVSGGADSDIMLDMVIRSGLSNKVDFIFFNTGFEYRATLEHLDFLERKYGIVIQRVRPKKPAVIATREYGVPFWGKYASNMIQRLQAHGFKWEDKPLDELLKEYHNCKTALAWWCNDKHGKTDQYIIDRSPYLKEFMIENPPDFPISDRCCDFSKKFPSKHLIKSNGYDLVCLGIRREENGARSGAHKTCFFEGKNANYFYPVFWFRDSDKAEYCSVYDITHSRCYTEYGLKRTGCVGCPFGKRFEEELIITEKHEPQFSSAVNNIFGKSYDYTRKFLKYRQEKKEQE